MGVRRPPNQLLGSGAEISMDIMRKVMENRKKKKKQMTIAKNTASKMKTSLDEPHGTSDTAELEITHDEAQRGIKTLRPRRCIIYMQ